MSPFNKIVSRLSRPTSQREDGTATLEPEYTVKPVFELKETDDAWGLTVHLPGVAKEGLDLSVEQGLVSIRGERAWEMPADWTQLYRESVAAPFMLELEHDNTVDAEKIRAELKDGILRVSLPKTEEFKPRKIAIE